MRKSIVEVRGWQDRNQSVQQEDIFAILYNMAAGLSVSIVWRHQTQSALHYVSTRVSCSARASFQTTQTLNNSIWRVKRRTNMNHWLRLYCICACITSGAAPVIMEEADLHGASICCTSLRLVQEIQFNVGYFLMFFRSIAQDSKNKILSDY